jgi:hypothetical protein
MGCRNGKSPKADHPSEIGDNSRRQSLPLDPMEGSRDKGSQSHDVQLDFPENEYSLKKVPKVIERKKINGNMNGTNPNPRYMQIDRPAVLNSQRRSPPSSSSPVIPSSKYIGHLSKPLSKTDEVQMPDGRTPLTSNRDTDPELLSTIRASAAHKRATSAIKISTKSVKSPSPPPFSHNYDLNPLQLRSSGF